MSDNTCSKVRRRRASLRYCNLLVISSGVVPRILARNGIEGPRTRRNEQTLASDTYQSPVAHAATRIDVQHALNTSTVTVQTARAFEHASAADRAKPCHAAFPSAEYPPKIEQPHATARSTYAAIMTTGDNCNKRTRTCNGQRTRHGLLLVSIADCTGCSDNRHRS